MERWSRVLDWSGPMASGTVAVDWRTWQSFRMHLQTYWHSPRLGHPNAPAQASTWSSSSRSGPGLRWARSAGIWRAPCLRLRDRGDFHPPVPGPSFLVGIGGNRLLVTECGGEHLPGGDAVGYEGAGDGKRTGGGQLQVVGKPEVALQHRPVVGEAAHHQDLPARLQVARQRRRQALQQRVAFGLQLVGIEREQDA